METNNETVEDIEREIEILNDTIDANLRVHKAAERSDADAKLLLNEEIVKRDALIAELRECLKDAVTECCYDCDYYDGDDGCTNTEGSCPVQRCLKALKGSNDGQH